MQTNQSKMITQYLGALFRVRDHLSPRVDCAKVTISGRASFLYAEHAERAVEVYRHTSAQEKGGWWIEYWATEEQPIRDECVDDADDAARKAQEWLLQPRA